jgi:hypothetical protein
MSWVDSFSCGECKFSLSLSAYHGVTLPGYDIGAFIPSAKPHLSSIFFAGMARSYRFLCAHQGYTAIKILACAPAGAGHARETLF